MLCGQKSNTHQSRWGMCSLLLWRLSKTACSSSSSVLPGIAQFGRCPPSSKQPAAGRQCSAQGLPANSTRTTTTVSTSFAPATICTDGVHDTCKMPTNFMLLRHAQCVGHAAANNSRQPDEPCHHRSIRACSALSHVGQHSTPVSYHGRRASSQNALGSTYHGTFDILKKERLQLSSSLPLERDVPGCNRYTWRTSGTC